MAISKYSYQREKILEVLQNTKSHPTASDVYDKVRQDIPSISLGTVYRNLANLSEAGQILKLSVGTAAEHFDGDISPHYHIICTKCQKIVDVFEHKDNLNSFAQKYFGGKITEHSLIFYGECENCLDKN